MSKPPITAREAGAIWNALPKQTVPALAAELVRRGTPVSSATLRYWKRHSWQTQSRSCPAGAAIDQARAAARKVGIPADAIRDLEARLDGMSDGELVSHVTRSLLINAQVLMTLAQQQAPKLMKTDARGLAAIYLAADRMVEGAHDLMREARNLAERAMKEKCGLLLAAPAGASAEGLAKPQPRAGAFLALIEKFGGVKVPSADDTTVVDGEAVEILHPGSKTVN